MLIGQWREYFFLILLREEGKITVIAMDPRKIKDARLG